MPRLQNEFIQLMMSWNPQYRSSKFRHVYGKAASKENCYDNVPITHSVYDNQFCAVNPRFIAVVTECAGGGAFLVIPISQVGKLDPHYPRICGHKGNVLDIKWNPFDDFVIASCSEDTTVKVWNIPQHLLTKSITDAQKDLLGHSRRVGLIEWHPTASNILFSTGYDYKVMIWNIDTKEHTIQTPDDLSVPLHEEDVDGSSGLLFPFYDTDTQMLYVLSKGDGNIRYYEINVEKPYLHYLTEYRSPFPQKGIGPVLMSLRPGSVILNSLPPFLEKEIAMEATKPVPCRDRATVITEKLNEIQEKWGTRKTEERQQQNRLMNLSNGVDTYECPPPKTENELLQMFYRQQEEIRRLREVLIQRDIQIKQLQLEIKNRHVDSRRF
ncbi:Coronin-2A, partial [Ophiophagus hannah]